MNYMTFTQALKDLKVGNSFRATDCYPTFVATAIVDDKIYTQTSFTFSHSSGVSNLHIHKNVIYKIYTDEGIIIRPGFEHEKDDI